MKKDGGVGAGQIRIGDGAGVAAAVMIPGSVAVFLTGSPDLWLFPVGATLIGLAISAVQRYFRSARIMPFSFRGKQDGSDRAKSGLSIDVEVSQCR